jgi:AcrR family transcriptional regulator
MAKKTKEEAEKTRIKILYTALDLFFEKGYARTTLDDIAGACGVTRGAIYWHFKDKADLLLTLGQQIDGEAEVNYSTLLEESTIDLESLIHRIGRYLAQLEENENYCKFYYLVQYKVEWDAELEPLLANYREEIRGLLRVLGQALSRLKEEGTLRNNVDTDELALATWAFIEGFIGMWFFDPEIFSLQQTGAKLIGDYLRQFSVD